MLIAILSHYYHISRIQERWNTKLLLSKTENELTVPANKDCFQMFLLCIFLVRFLYLSQDAIISKKLKRFVSEWKSSWEGGLTRWWGSIQVEKCPNLGFSTRSHYWWDKRVKLFQQDEALKLCSKPKCGDWNCKIQSRLDVDFSGHLIPPWHLFQVHQWTSCTSFYFLYSCLF